MTSLADYKLDILAEVRDSRSQFTSDQMLVRYINQARKQVAVRSACLQALVTGQSAFGTSAQPGSMIPGAFIPGTLPGSASSNSNSPGSIATASNSFVTISGVEMYTYNYANPYLQAQYQGYDKVIYVANISVSWGGYKPTLRWMPWPDLQAYCRILNTGVTSYPCAWAAKGVGENGQAWLFPMPVNLAFGTMDWEVVCTPKPLYTNADFEALPDMYHSAVVYYAARQIYLAQQRTGLAEVMDGLFTDQLQINSVGSDWGHCEDFYAQLSGF